MLDKMKTGGRIGTRILTLALSLVLVLGTMVMFPNDSAKAKIANHKLTVNFKNLDVDGNEISGPNNGGSARVFSDKSDISSSFPIPMSFDIIYESDVEISCNQEYAGYKFKEIILDEDTGWEKMNTESTPQRASKKTRRPQ